MSKSVSPWVVRPLVPEEIYVERTEFVDYFYHEATPLVYGAFGSSSHGQDGNFSAGGKSSLL